MTTRFAALFLLMAIFAYFPIRPAYADCSGPEGVEGEQIYNKTHQTMQFCDGSVWWSMKSGGIVALTNLGECADGHPLVFDEENGNLRCDISPPSPSQPSGSLDTTFNPGSGPEGTGANVHAVAVQPDGNILIGGNFTSYDGTARNRIARLNANGSLDTSFDPGSGANSTVQTIMLQPDGKILIAGGFGMYNGEYLRNIARLNTDGSVYTSIITTNGVSGGLLTMAPQPDGKILIGDSFSAYHGTTRYFIARLNANGSLDTSFDPGNALNNFVHAIALQPDGKILIGGRFTSYDGTTRNRIARLNTDGSLDTSFNPGSGADDNIYALVLQPDGKIMIGGNFTSYDGTARNRIARLNANGSLDTSFDPGSGANSTVQTIMLQPDGKILFGGSFSRYDEMARMRFARLNANGSLDTSFDPGNGANNTVYSIAVQPDGKILIGGAFTSYDDKTRNRIARINP